MRRNRWSMTFACAVLLAPAALLAQSESPVEVGGLLRTGFHIEPESSGEADGFDIFDARIKVSGKIGIVFDYFLQTDYDTRDNVFRILDAKATLPIFPELSVSFGQFRPPFALEAQTPKGQLTFLERAQSSTAIAPGRQVGISANGAALDGRLTYGAGLFNGNGRTLENDGNDFMFASRVQFNSIGTIAFYEDLVVQAGASILYSKDTSAPLGAGMVTGDPASVPELTSVFGGERFLWNADVVITFRGWSLTGEYLRGDYDIALPADVTPTPGVGDEADAYGGYVELGYRAWGAIELVTRYDGFSPAVGENRDFMVFGVNVYPGYYAKFGIQYAAPLSGSPNAPTLAENQFIFLAQVDF